MEGPGQGRAGGGLLGAKDRAGHFRRPRRSPTAASCIPSTTSSRTVSTSSKLSMCPRKPPGSWPSGRLFARAGR